MRAPTTKKAQEILDNEKAAKKLRQAFKGEGIEVDDQKIRLKKAPKYRPNPKKR